MPKKSSCPFCGDAITHEALRTEYFVYGAGDDATLLSADVVVIECSDTQGCGGRWTDYRSEDARQAAVERHLASKGVYLCAICHEIPVDVHNGYDTCDNCVGRV